MVDGLLLSETVCIVRWKSWLPLCYCLAAGLQLRIHRCLNNQRVDGEAL